jgi:hypothetical protein
MSMVGTTLSEIANRLMILLLGCPSVRNGAFDTANGPAAGEGAGDVVTSALGRFVSCCVDYVRTCEEMIEIASRS